MKADTRDKDGARGGTFTVAGLRKAMGPGIILAGSAIGGSHLIQSTRGGADFGPSVIWLILVINLLKYPFFEFGHRYACVQGESLLQAYRRQGRWVLWSSAGVVLINAVVGLAGLAMVTAGLAAFLVSHVAGGVLLPPGGWLLATYFVCVLCLFRGYGLFDRVTKIFVALLSVSTVVACVLCFQIPAPTPEAGRATLLTGAGLVFCVQLGGWMPAPLEASLMSSLWSVAHHEEQAYRPSLREALWDFRIGYALSAVLAVAFAALGHRVLGGAGVPFPAQSLPFAETLVTMYTKVLGGWTFYLVAIAAFSCMFSTLLTALDGYIRIFAETAQLQWPKIAESQRQRGGRAVILLALSAAVAILLLVLQQQMLPLINLATTVAFLSMPFFGYFNWRAVTSGGFERAVRPGMGMALLTWAGLFFATAVVLGYGWLEVLGR